MTPLMTWLEVFQTDTSFFRTRFPRATACTVACNQQIFFEAFFEENVFDVQHQATQDCIAELVLAMYNRGCAIFFGA